jgi:hypothetical protein
MLGPGAIGVRGSPAGWTAVVHFHAASAESAKSMAIMQLTSASCNAHLPPPHSLSCEATPDVDNPSDGDRQPYLSWTVPSGREAGSIPAQRRRTA